MFSSKFTIIIFPLTFLNAFEVLPEEKICVSLSFKPIWLASLLSHQCAWVSSPSIEPFENKSRHWSNIIIIEQSSKIQFYRWFSTNAASRRVLEHHPLDLLLSFSKCFSSGFLGWEKGDFFWLALKHYPQSSSQDLDFSSFILGNSLSALNWRLPYIDLSLWGLVACLACGMNYCAWLEFFSFFPLWGSSW